MENEHKPAILIRESIAVLHGDRRGFNRLQTEAHIGLKIPITKAAHRSISPKTASLSVDPFLMAKISSKIYVVHCSRENYINYGISCRTASKTNREKLFSLKCAIESH